MRADGSNVQRLTNDPASDALPQFSASGNSILFENNRGGDYEIYRMRADGSHVEQLTHNHVDDVAPTAAPLGGRIAFTRAKSEGDAQVMTMGARGSNVRPLTQAPGFNGGANYSPNGKWIAFQSDRKGDPNVFKMRADGSHQRRLTRSPDFEPSRCSRRTAAGSRSSASETVTRRSSRCAPMARMSANSPTTGASKASSAGSRADARQQRVPSARG